MHIERKKWAARLPEQKLNYDNLRGPSKEARDSRARYKAEVQKRLEEVRGTELNRPEPLHKDAHVYTDGSGGSEETLERAHNK